MRSERPLPDAYNRSVYPLDEKKRMLIICGRHESMLIICGRHESMLIICGRHESICIYVAFYFSDNRPALPGSDWSRYGRIRGRNAEEWERLQSERQADLSGMLSGFARVEAAFHERAASIWLEV